VAKSQIRLRPAVQTMVRDSHPSGSYQDPWIVNERTIANALTQADYSITPQKSASVYDRVCFAWP
jgi:hypothetical protein